MTNANTTTSNKNIQTDTKYLTVEEVSDTLNIHPETTRRYLKKAQIKGFKLPGGAGDWRIASSDLQKFIDSMETNK